MHTRSTLALSVCLLAALACNPPLIGGNSLSAPPGSESRASLPLYPDSTRVDLDDEQLVDFVNGEYGGFYLIASSSISLDWTEEDDLDTITDELDERLDDAGWNDESDWEESGWRTSRTWEQDDLRTLIQIYPDMQDDVTDLFNDKYNIELEEGTSLIISIVHATEASVSLSGSLPPGWTTCDFEETNLSIACLETWDAAPLGGTPGLSLGFFMDIHELDESGIEDFDRWYGFSPDLDDSPDEIIDRLSTRRAWDFEYSDNDIQTVQTGVGRATMVTGEQANDLFLYLAVLNYNDYLLLFVVEGIGKDGTGIVSDLFVEMLGTVKRR